LLTGEIRNPIAEPRIVPVAVPSVPQDTTAPAHQATMGNDAACTKTIAEEAIPCEQANYTVTRASAKIIQTRS
jgi:hypothetical protein